MKGLDFAKVFWILHHAQELGLMFGFSEGSDSEMSENYGAIADRLREIADDPKKVEDFSDTLEFLSSYANDLLYPKKDS